MQDYFNENSEKWDEFVNKLNIIAIFGSEEENSSDNNIGNHLNKDRVSFFNKDKSIDVKFESIKNINLKDLLNN